MCPWEAKLAKRILIVDDDADMCETLAAGLRPQRFEVSWRTSGEQALDALNDESFDVVVADLLMPGMSGVQLCERILASWPDVLVVVITAFGSLDTAISAIRAGAYDFLTKPFEFAELAMVLERAVKVRDMDREIKRLRQTVEQASGDMFGDSPAMRELRSLLERIGDSSTSVLITGESGTGKELVAHTLHRQSGRRGELVALNCAAMPESLLESELFGHAAGAFTDAKKSREGMFRRADGGTLFLDEIGDMPASLQAKLLRALQEHRVRPVGGDREYEFDARLITATNKDLESAVEAGTFREDLYFRLNVIHVQVPPLRARGNDVLVLAHRFLERFAKREGKPIGGLAPPAIEKLLAYSWPGNVRELENCLERAVTMARHDHILVADLPEKIRDYKVAHIIGATTDPADLVTMEEIERRYISRVMELVGGNKSQAAKVLGFDRKTLYRRLERYGLG
jgi:two-component system response regulator HydG